MDILSVLLQLAFYAVFAAAIWRFARRPGKVELAVVAVFSATAAVFSYSLLNTLAPDIGQFFRPLALTLLLAQPLLIFVLIRLIMPLAAWLIPAVIVVFVIATGALLLPGETTPAAALLVGAYFITAEGAAAILLLRGSRRRYGIARIRLALAATSTALFGLAILIVSIGAAAAAGGPTDPTLQFISRIAALLAGIGYLGAFVPPRWLRDAGHRAVAFELARDLVTARVGSDSDVLWRNLADTARGVLGVSKVSVSDGSGTLLAHAEDADGSTANRPADGGSAPADAAHRATTAARVPIVTDGQLRATIVADIEGWSLFVEDDLEVLGLLGLMTVRAVEREEAIVRLAEARRQLEAAAAVRASEARFRALLEAHPNAVLAVDGEGRVIWATGPTAELFGAPAEELHDERLSRLIAVDKPLLNESPGSASARRLEATGYRLDGSAFPADIAMTPFELDGRRHEMIVISDASWRHEASLLRDRFLGILSHELRTPITAIYGGTQLLMGRAERMPADDRRELLASIAAESERLQRIIENLLILARVERGADFFEPRPVSVKPVLSEVVARERPLWPAMTINLAVAPGVPLVAADEEYLALILRNLLSNAAKYAGPDATVDIRVMSSGDEVKFLVCDDGPGIDPDEADKLFTLYFRSPSAQAAQGAGIGLFVCKGLVNAMNGRIWARPRDEGGAEFGFALPQCRDEDEIIERQASRARQLADPAPSA
jgi:PAS domain S-box-containing protein